MSVHVVFRSPGLAQEEILWGEIVSLREIEQVSGQLKEMEVVSWIPPACRKQTEAFLEGSWRPLKPHTVALLAVIGNACQI